MNKEIGKHCLSMLLPVIFLSCSANTGGMFGEAAGELNFTEVAFESGAFRLGPAINSMAAMTAKEKAKLLYEEGLYSEGIFSPNVKAEDPAQMALEFILERPSGDDLNYFFLGWIAESKGYLDAAYEYYNLSKVLFDYDESALESEYEETGQIFDSALSAARRASNQIYISYCGYGYREPSFFGGNSMAIQCPDNIAEELSATISRLERQLGL